MFQCVQWLWEWVGIEDQKGYSGVSCWIQVFKIGILLGGEVVSCSNKLFVMRMWIFY